MCIHQYRASDRTGQMPNQFEVRTSHTSAYRLEFEPCLPFDILSRQKLEWNLLLHQDGSNASSTSGHIVCIKFEDHCSESKLEVKRFGWSHFTIGRPPLYQNDPPREFSVPRNHICLRNHDFLFLDWTLCLRNSEDVIIHSN